MYTPYQRMAIADQQRIDARIFCGEVNRLIGEGTFQPNDPRLLHVENIELEERIDYLRNLYAVDLKAPEPMQRFKWSEKLEDIQYRRCLKLQENITRSGQCDGYIEAMVDMLDLPYMPKPAVINHR